MNAKIALLPDLNGALDLTTVRAHLREAVQQLFQELHDKAILFTDECIAEPLVKAYLGNPDMGFEELNLPVAHHQALCPHGLLSATQAEVPKHTNFVFIVHNHPERAQLVAQHILEIKRLHERGRTSAAQLSFWVAAYPEAGLAFHKVLAMAGVTTSGDAKVRGLDVPYFPLGRDLLSMHRPSAVKELLVDSDPAILHETATALVHFARAFGLPHRIQALGHDAVKAAELFRRSLHETAASGDSGLSQNRAVGKWVLFDRMADLVTPLMSQLTMEGRLDDLQDVSLRAGWLPGERGAGTDPHVRSIKVLLHAGTPEWCEWRERHVQDLPLLQARAAELEARRHEGGATDNWLRANHLRYLQRPLHYLGRDMLRVLQPGGPLAEQHAAEVALLEHRSRRGGGLWAGASGAPNPADVLAELIASGASFELCARRLCLSVLAHGALSESQFLECTALLLDSFGHQHIHTLTNLQAAGLIVHRTQAALETESSLRAMRSLLDKAEQNARSGKEPPTLSALISSADEMPAVSEGSDAAAAGDGSSSSSGAQPYGRYHPLSALLLSHAMKRYMPDWVKRHLRNCAVSQGRPAQPSDVFASYAILEQPSTRAFVPERRDVETPLAQHTPRRDAAGPVASAQIVLIIMLGGCTLAELTAVKAAAEQLGLRPVILTTDVFTSDRLIRSFVPDSARLATDDAIATMNAL